MALPTLNDWNSGRVNAVSSSQAFQAAQHGVQDMIEAQHWISLMCFVEQVDPASLALSPHLLERIEQELNILKRCEPLETYAAALSRLSTDTTAFVAGAEMSDVEPN